MFRPLLADGRDAAGRLAGLRAAGREDRDVVARVLEPADLVEEPEAVGEDDANMLDDRGIDPMSDSIDADEPAAVRRPVEVLDRVVLLVDDAVRGLVDEDDLGEVERDEAEPDEVEREAVVRGLVVDRRVVVERRVAGAAAAGLAVDMVLAAAVSAFAAVVMALVAVFMACIAADMVFADVVALVAAAVIFVAADVTLVAAEDTVLAAEAGVVVLLDEERDEVLPVVRDEVLRDDVLRDDVLRGVVLRDEVLRVDRDAGVREVDDVVLLDGLDAVLRVVRDDVDDAVVLGRLPVPDALRLADLLRPVLAELRRLAALVVF